MGTEVAIGALIGGALAAATAPGKPPKAKPPPEPQLPKGVAAKTKQKAVGAYGAMDTALTGPQGLGSTKPVGKGYASLLGGTT